MAIKVAIVEDNHEIREGLKWMMSQSPELECVYDFSNVEDAIKKIPEQCLDVVLMDINLPGMNGIEAIKHLKPLYPNTQFMMLTVYEDDTMIFKSLQAGATGYLLKGSLSEEVKQAIIDLHNGGSPMSPGIARKVLNAFQVNTPKIEPDFQNLSEREIEIVDKLAQGFRYKEISDKLNISTGTVRKHIQNIYFKLHVQSRTEALNKIFKA